MRPAFVLLGFVGCALLGSVLLVPNFESVKAASPASACLSNVKLASLGLILYAADHDDRDPSRDAWMDASLPYVKTEANWHCPSVPKAAFGYAFNGALSFAKPPVSVGTTPLIYDSANPIRNASDLFTSLPRPGRHRGKNSVAYSDGHAKAVPAP